MATVYEIHSASCVARIGVTGPVIHEQDARWCALLQRLVRQGGAITLELVERMSAAGLDLDRLHRCLRSARRKAPARGDVPPAPAR